MNAMSTTNTRTRSVALIGVSHRTIRLWRQLPDSLNGRWRICALWDVDPQRFEAYAFASGETSQPDTYLGRESLDRMLREQRPDLAFVATRDCHHADCIIACLDAGVDVVVEKPMVIDCTQAQAVLAAEARSTARVRVAFNYRYKGDHETIKRELDSGLIGRVTAVEMNVYLDEIHGSSYFQRWNRYRSQSGGLTIHKEGHYLDLINWWLGQKPVELFGYSALNYYGPDGELNPSRRDGRHCSTCEEADACAYQQVRGRKRSADNHSTSLQTIESGLRTRNPQWYTDYRLDACIFDSDIDIEDTYASVISYDGGTMATFSVNFSSPFEQYRIVFNGTRGRLEYGYPFGAEGSYSKAGKTLVHYPLFAQEPRVIPVQMRPGGHGGADPAMLEDILGGDQRLSFRASARDGAYAAALGEAMWRSPKEGRPIRMAELLGEWR